MAFLVRRQRRRVASLIEVLKSDVRLSRMRGHVEADSVITNGLFADRQCWCRVALFFSETRSSNSRWNLIDIAFA